MKKKILLIILALVICFPIIGCDGNTPPPDDSGYGVDTGYTAVYEQESEGYTYEGVKTAAPYRVMNEDGTIIDRYSSIFRAIQQAGIKGTTKNKTFVLDQTGLVVFQRQAMNQHWCYDGTRFVGSKSSADASAWAGTKSRSYVINGQGSGYVKLGSVLMPNSAKPQDGQFELFSGSYNYMFSKGGEYVTGGENIMGYGYMRGYVLMSKVRYRAPKDSLDLGEGAGDGWNAYIFFNNASRSNIDLGMIGNVINGTVEWRLVRNCSYNGSDNPHSALDPSFNVLEGSNPVTTLKYNAATDEYTGGDDLLMEVWSYDDGWVLKITNLVTGAVRTINERHEDMHVDSHVNSRFLLAASYCPTYKNGQVWNARSGGYLKDVEFVDVQLARYKAPTENFPYGEYKAEDLEDFYPGSANMSHGFSQSADGADFKFGTYSTGGTIGTGTNAVTYETGTRYTVFSCYYDGSH